MSFGSDEMNALVKALQDSLSLDKQARDAGTTKLQSITP